MLSSVHMGSDRDWCHYDALIIQTSVIVQAANDGPLNFCIMKFYYNNINLLTLMGNAFEGR